MKQVKILSGISGSGKSTFSNKLSNESSVYCSADDYHIIDGEYSFNANNLKLAHAECFKKFIMAMMDNVSLIIVDNTNICIEEISPYVLGATAFGYEYEIISFIPSSEDALNNIISRNIHGVPAEVVRGQYVNLIGRVLPEYWNSKIVDVY